MAKMPDHINVTVGYVVPQTSTAVPCNHVFPYWSVIPPTHCPVCGACLAPPPPPPPCPYHPPYYPWWPAPSAPRYPRYETVTITCANTC